MDRQGEISVTVGMLRNVMTYWKGKQAALEGQAKSLDPKVYFREHTLITENIRTIEKRIARLEEERSCGLVPTEAR